MQTRRECKRHCLSAWCLA